jgi:hypothetical protein
VRIVQSSLNASESEQNCSRCGQTLLGRFFHRISENGGSTELVCCPCFVGSEPFGADWHPECKAQAEKDRPLRKFADGERVRHIKNWGCSQIAGQTAVVEEGSFAGGVNWSYALKGDRGLYAWVDESELVSDQHEAAQPITALRPA